MTRKAAEGEDACRVACDSQALTTISPFWRFLQNGFEGIN